MLCVLQTRWKSSFFTHKSFLGEGLCTTPQRGSGIGGFKSRKCSLSCQGSFSLGQHLQGKSLVPCGLSTMNRQHWPHFCGSLTWSSPSRDEVGNCVSSWMLLESNTQVDSISRSAKDHGVLCVEERKGFSFSGTVFSGNQGNVGPTSSGDR